MIKRRCKVNCSRNEFSAEQFINSCFENYNVVDIKQSSTYAGTCTLIYTTVIYEYEEKTAAEIEEEKTLLKIIVELDNPQSVTLIQEGLNIGFNEASRLMETLEHLGIVSPRINGKRKVLMDKALMDKAIDDYINDTKNNLK